MRFCRNCHKNKLKANRVTYEYCKECQDSLAKIPNEKMQELYQKLHASKKYGVSADDFIELVEPSIKELHPIDILDFGCGQSKFVDLLDVDSLEVRKRYDFAIPEHSTLPYGKFDIVTCLDVMEHVPEGNLDDILQKIKSKSNNVIFKISCTIAGNLLEGGINAHCTLKHGDEWIKLLKNYFPIITIIPYRELEIELVCKTW